MVPFIHDGTEVRLKREAEYRRGDIVLALTDEGKVVLHYVAGIDEKGFTLMGAGNLIQQEHCSKEDVAGRVVEPRIGRWPVMAWHFMRPLRRGMLWMLRRRNTPRCGLCREHGVNH